MLLIGSFRGGESNTQQIKDLGFGALMASGRLNAVPPKLVHELALFPLHVLCNDVDISIILHKIAMTSIIRRSRFYESAQLR